MVLKYLASGFLVKLITGIDDSMVHIPIIANMTRTRLGRIAFAVGILFAITLAIIFSFLFASTIRLIPYYKYLSAGLIFVLAFTIYFDLLIHKPKEKVEKKLKKIKRISAKRFLKLIGIGFITAFATVIDDTIAYSSLFLSLTSVYFVIIGIYLATITQLIMVVYFSKKIQKMPYKKEITVFGLIILGFLILRGII